MGYSLVQEKFRWEGGWATRGWCGGGSDAEHLLGARDVALLELDHAGVAAVLLAASGGRRGRERSAGLPAGLQTTDLARAGHLEALAGARVGLVLRHVCLNFLVRGSGVLGGLRLAPRSSFGRGNDCAAACSIES